MKRKTLITILALAFALSTAMAMYNNHRINMVIANARVSQEEAKEQQNKDADENAILVLQGTGFEVYRLEDRDGYQYLIYGNDETLLSEGKMTTIPEFVSVGENLLRMQCEYWQGGEYVRYFDVENGLISPVYEGLTNYAEWIDSEEAWIAFFKQTEKETAELVVESIFDNQEESFTIVRGFVSAEVGAKELKFLNADEIYMEYDEVNNATPKQYVQEGLGTVVRVKEIVKFRENECIYKEFVQK